MVLMHFKICILCPFLFILQLSVTIYAKDLEKAKCGQGGIPDRQILKEARADLERVLSVRPCLRTHLEMGQVVMRTKDLSYWSKVWNNYGFFVCFQ